MTDRTRNSAEKRKGQLTKETARNQAGAEARAERRATEGQPAPTKRKGLPGRMRGSRAGAPQGK